MVAGTEASHISVRGQMRRDTIVQWIGGTTQEGRGPLIHLEGEEILLPKGTRITETRRPSLMDGGWVEIVYPQDSIAELEGVAAPYWEAIDANKVARLAAVRAASAALGEFIKANGL